MDTDSLRRQYEKMSFEDLVFVKENAVLPDDARIVLDKILKKKEAEQFVGKNLEDRARELFDASPLVLELRQYAEEERIRLEEEKRENWFYTLDGQSQEGPVSLNTMRERISAGKIDKNTLVWCPKLDEWSKAGSIEDLYKKKKESSTATIKPPSIPGKILGTGTGWFVTHDVIVTNYHVIEGGNNYSAIVNGNQEVTASPVAIDRVNDLAILKLNSRFDNIAPFPLSSITEKQGARVFTMGFPHADVLGQKSKLTDGLVSAITGIEDDHRFYQISVPLQSGNSGGPLVNLRGGVVGIVTAKLSAVTIYNATGDLPENVNYAVKTAYLKILLDSEGISYNESKDPDGISIEDLSEKYSSSVSMVLVRS